MARTLTLPSRDFILVIDPSFLEEVIALNRGGVLRLIHELKQLPTPVDIHLIFPAYMSSGEDRQRAAALAGVLDILPDEAGVPPFVLSREIPRRYTGRIERGAEGDRRGLRLLALAEHLNADGIVTALASIVEAGASLRRNHGFRILQPADVLDFVEVCARGHSVSCAARPEPTWLPPDVLYQFAHWKARRLFDWFNKVSPRIEDPVLREHLRSALLNRYPFILWARDMVRFYDIQKQHYLRRRGRPAVFRTLLNYHLTAFYVHIWGMLDTLAGIANRHLALGLPPRKCYLAQEEFLETLEGKSPGLARFIKEHRGRWVDVIGDVRHPVAHSALLLQGDVVTHTEESKKSDAEIAPIVRAENEEFLNAIPPEFAPAIEATLISHWRERKMKVVTDDAIHVEHSSGGGYVRGPVAKH